MGRCGAEIVRRGSFGLPDMHAGLLLGLELLRPGLPSSTRAGAGHCPSISHSSRAAQDLAWPIGPGSDGLFVPLPADRALPLRIIAHASTLDKRPAMPYNAYCRNSGRLAQLARALR